MNSQRLASIVMALLIALVSPQLTYGQAPPTDAAVYDQFRAWSSSRPADTGGQARTQLPDLMSEYRKTLAADGVAAGEIERRLEVIRRSARRAEVERWNKILTSSNPTFNVQPN